MERFCQLAIMFIVNCAWQASLIAVMAWLCARLMRRAPSRYVHRLWAGALLCAVLLPLAIAVNAGLAERSASLSRAVMSAAIVHGQGRLPSRAHFPSALWLSASWIWVITASYLLVVLLRGAGMLRACFATWQLSAAARPASPSVRVAAIFSLCRSRLSVGPVVLFCSASARSPLTLGLRRHKIVLAESIVRSAGDEDWLTILSHEMAHIRRHDFLKNLFYELLYWPVALHPAAAWMRREIRRTRELACDEMATESLASPAGYARSLVGIAGMISGLPGQRSHYGLGISDPEILEERVMNVLHRRCLSTFRAGSLLALAVVALIAVSLSAAAFAIVVKEKPSTAPSASAGKAAVPPGQDDQVFEVGNGVTAPRPLSTPEPRYPQPEHRANTPGHVTLSLVVGTDGHVREWQVVSSSGKNFENAAVAAVSQWIFEPATKDGQAVAVKLKVDVEFQVYDKKDKSDS